MSCCRATATKPLSASRHRSNGSAPDKLPLLSADAAGYQPTEVGHVPDFDAPNSPYGNEDEKKHLGDDFRRSQRPPSLSFPERRHSSEAQLQHDESVIKQTLVRREQTQKQSNRFNDASPSKYMSPVKNSTGAHARQLSVTASPLMSSRSTIAVRHTSEYGGSSLLREYYHSQFGNSQEMSHQFDGDHRHSEPVHDVGRIDCYSGALPLYTEARMPSISGVNLEIGHRRGNQQKHTNNLSNLVRYFSFKTEDGRTDKWWALQEASIKEDKQRLLARWLSRFEGGCGKKAPPAPRSSHTFPLNTTVQSSQTSTTPSWAQQQRKRHVPSAQLVQLLERDVGNGRPGLGIAAWSILALVEEAANYTWRQCRPFIIAYYLHQQGCSTTNTNASCSSNVYSSNFLPPAVQKKVAEVKSNFTASWNRLRGEVRTALTKQAEQEMKKLKASFVGALDVVSRQHEADPQHGVNLSHSTLAHRTPTIGQNRTATPLFDDGTSADRSTPRASGLFSSFLGNKDDEFLTKDTKKLKSKAKDDAYEYYGMALKQLSHRIANPVTTVGVRDSLWNTFDLSSTWAQHLLGVITNEHLTTSLRSIETKHPTQQTTQFDIAKRLQLLWFFDVALVLPLNVHQFFKQRKSSDVSMQTPIHSLRIPVASKVHRRLHHAGLNSSNVQASGCGDIFYHNFPEHFEPRDENIFRRIPTMDILQDDKIQAYRTKRFTRITNMRVNLLTSLGTTLSLDSSLNASF